MLRYWAWNKNAKTEALLSNNWRDLILKRLLLPKLVHQTQLIPVSSQQSIAIKMTYLISILQFI